MRDVLATCARAIRAVLGAPDYDRYVAHMRARHPEQVPLSYAELIAERDRARFERPGGRCC